MSSEKKSKPLSGFLECLPVVPPKCTSSKVHAEIEANITDIMSCIYHKSINKVNGNLPPKRTRSRSACRKKSKVLLPRVSLALGC